MRSIPVLAWLALAASLPAADIASRLEALVKETPPEIQGLSGIHVVDLAARRTVYAHNAAQLYLPASNMKLFTAALALTKLGPAHRFETRLVREPSGSLALIGSGDPSLSGRVYPYDRQARPGPALGPIDALVDQAIAAGLTSVEGDIIGDDRLYLWNPYPPSWTHDDALYDYGAPVSALTVNDNVQTIRIQPGAKTGALARVSFDPPIEYFAVDNRVTTVAGSTSNVHIARVPGKRQLMLTGSVGLRAGDSEPIALDDPALFAAHALYDALLRRGIRVRGRPVARHRMETGPGPAVEGATLATRISPPLAELLQGMVKVSHNLHAELFQLAAGPGEMPAFLRQAGIGANEWRAEDASGLARNDEVSPQAITRLLTYMAASTYKDLWLSLLPVGGQDGTLSNRLCCVSDASSIRAKTGTLARSIALSGYADTRSGGRLAFSIMVNNFAAPSSQVRAWVDKIALALLE